jgi:hypothetical protein
MMVSTPNAPDGLFERIKKLKILVCTKGYFWTILMVLVKYIHKKK